MAYNYRVRKKVDKTEFSGVILKVTTCFAVAKQVQNASRRRRRVFI